MRAVPATISIVDDDVSILDSMKLYLESYHWIVRVYLTGEAFLADFDNHSYPDCVVLDPHLPGMSGLDVIQAMPYGGANIPIIGLTARPESSVTLAMTNSGLCVMLRKPVAPEVLIDQLKAAISS